MNVSTFLERLRPRRRDLVDAAFAVVLCTLGVIGFDSAFGGQEAFTVGIPAVLTGVVIGYLIGATRPPVIVGLIVAVGAFFVLGGAFALREDAAAGVLPTPAVWSGLVDGAVNGWARLITTVPPAGRAGNLLTIPYLVGYASGLLSMIAALGSRRWPWCVVPPAVALGLSVLFGVEEPAFLVLQGGIFGVLVVAWIAIRADRTDRPQVLHATPSRVVGSIGLLAVAVLGGLVVGPRLPMADANDRYILRNQIEPPFDPSEYPTPLGRYRAFHGPEEPSDEVLFTVEGLPPGERVRFAVLDTYDGYVWRASPPGTSLGGTYHRVGDQIVGAAAGESATVRFTMGALAHADSVWIPTAGSPTAIRFTGPAAGDLRESFRFNRATETAASPRPLDAGDTWEVVATFPTAPSDAEVASAPAEPYPFDAPVGFAETPAMVEAADRWTEGASTPWELATALDEKLKEVGALNDGGNPPIPSGHSLYRLARFVQAEQPQGNDEQFAATVAYLSRGLGIPSRVVMVFDVPEGDGPVEVTAEQARVVVEIALDEVGWVALPDVDYSPVPPSQQTSDDPVPNDPERQPPPPDEDTPPESIPEEADSNESDRDEADEVAAGGASALLLAIAKVVAAPVLIVGLPIGTIMGLKARRRRRRQTHGTPAEQVAGAWDEVIDLARDMGTNVPANATRRELVGAGVAAGAGPWADQVDAAVFGADEPDADLSRRAWEEVPEVRRQMLGGVGRRRRIRAAVSTRSLRGRR